MRLALFDLDGTLTRRDTLMPFLRHAVGTKDFVAGLVRLAPTLLAYATGAIANDVAKEAVLSHFLRGFRIDALREIGERFARRKLSSLLRPDAMERVFRHKAQGDVCVLVTASLDVYVQPWALRQGFEAALCSTLETQGDVVTGKLHGGNCYGPEKVRRIVKWLDGRQAEHVVAYGDSRGDREMLELADVAHYRGRMVKERETGIQRK